MRTRGYSVFYRSELSYRAFGSASVQMYLYLSETCLFLTSIIKGLQLKWVSIFLAYMIKYHVAAKSAAHRLHPH